MMKVNFIETAKIKLKGKDIGYFTSALEKITAAQSKVGFKGDLLSEDEINILNKIKDKL